MDDHVLAEQLRHRLDALESPDAAMHLGGDLALRDVLLTALTLVIVTVVLVWWAY